MTLDLTKLNIHTLTVLRNRLADDKSLTDLSVLDAKIAEYTPMKVVREWAAWELGDYAWADDIIRIYTEAQAAVADTPIPEGPKVWHNHTNNLYQPTRCSGCASMAREGR